jgi:hypothetical protein
VPPSIRSRPPDGLTSFPCWHQSVLVYRSWFLPRGWIGEAERRGRRAMSVGRVSVRDFFLGVLRDKR